MRFLARDPAGPLPKAVTTTDKIYFNYSRSLRNAGVSLSGLYRHMRNRYERVSGTLRSAKSARKCQKQAISDVTDHGGFRFPLLPSQARKYADVPIMPSLGHGAAQGLDNMFLPSLSACQLLLQCNAEFIQRFISEGGWFFHCCPLGNPSMDLQCNLCIVYIPYPPYHHPGTTLSPPWYHHPGTTLPPRLYM